MCVCVPGRRNKKKDARTAAATSATDGENEQQDSEPTDDVADDNAVDDGLCQLCDVTLCDKFIVSSVALLCGRRTTLILCRLLQLLSALFA